MNNAFYMSREELLKTTGTDPERGLNEAQVQASCLRGAHVSLSFVCTEVIRTCASVA